MAPLPDSKRQAISSMSSAMGWQDTHGFSTQ